MHERDLFNHPPKARRASAKPRKRPGTLGDCKPGDVVAVHICVTAHLNRTPFGRIVTDGHESELFDLPAEGRLVNVLKQVP